MMYNLTMENSIQPRRMRNVRAYADTSDFFNSLCRILAYEYNRNVTVAEVLEYCVRHDLSVAYDEFLKTRAAMSH